MRSFLCTAMLTMFLALAGNTQTLTVTGLVTDSEGKPLSGVSIETAGTLVKTVANDEGRYSINVPSGKNVLNFSFVGFATQSITIDGRETVDVQLERSDQSLEDVVVIGYGVKVKKGDLTGAVASANLDNATTFPNVSIAQALQGTLPGLNVGAVTSAGQNPSLSVRGQTTLSSSSSANAPLIVVDGIIYRGNLIDLNPADIASVDVLKDASSAAIYGSEASNGVILITSKAGKFSEKPIVEYSGSYSVQTPSNERKPMNSEEFKKFYPNIFWAEGQRIGPDFLEVNPDYNLTFRTNEIGDGYANGTDNNWWDLFTQNGFVNTHNVSIRGKSKVLGYFVSGGITDQQGYLKNDDYTRYNLRMNFDFKVNKWLDMGTQTFVSIGDYSGQSAGANTPYYLSPWAPLYNEEGEYETFPDPISLNPYLTISQKNKQINKNFSNILYANVKLPLDGLSYRINYANNYRTIDTSHFNAYANDLQGQAYRTFDEIRDYTVDNIITYQQTFHEDHAVNATLLYGVEKRTINGFDAQANIFAIDILGYDYLEGGDPQQNVVKSLKEVETSLYSMARVLYNYKQKYYFTGTVRRDGFSGFGEEKKIGIFPTVALGWAISKEHFLQDVSWLNFLKLRGSYGQTGRRGVGRYETKARIATGVDASYVFGDGSSSSLGQGISSLANNELGWETTTGTNLGIDFTLLKSRINGNFDFYKNRTENILYAIPLPRITGFPNINTNIAAVSNYGLDLSVTGAIIRNNEWRWNTTFNYSRNRNKIESLLGVDNNGDGLEDDLVGAKLFIGQPQIVIYDYEVTGMWQLADEIPTGFYPGTYKLRDINGDEGISPENDRKILGYVDPAYRFGIANNVSYKNFGLYVFINSIQGGKKYYFGNDSPHANGNWNKRDQLTYSNVPSGAWDYWLPENPNAKYRRLDLASQYGGDLYTQRNFVRLQDVSLSYTFTDQVKNTLKVKNLKMYFSAKNLLTLTKWGGSDPEIINPNNPNDIIGFIPAAPMLKSYTIGLNLEF